LIVQLAKFHFVYTLLTVCSLIDCAKKALVECFCILGFGSLATGQTTLAIGSITLGEMRMLREHFLSVSK